MAQHLAHAEAFASVVASLDPVELTGGATDRPVPEAGGRRSLRWLDLGSGGGLPGLVLATRDVHDWGRAGLPVHRPGTVGSQGFLLEAQARRAAFLRSALERLHADDVTVVEGRAEEAGRAEDLRGSMDVVVARSFGKPAVTAECGAPFLRVGGSLVVSEPPDGPDQRWPAEGVRRIGLVAVGSATENGYHFQVLRAEEACSPRFPRRIGVPAKRPLF